VPIPHPYLHLPTYMAIYGSIWEYPTYLLYICKYNYKYIGKIIRLYIDNRIDYLYYLTDYLLIIYLLPEHSLLYLVVLGCTWLCLYLSICSFPCLSPHLNISHRFLHRCFPVYFHRIFPQFFSIIHKPSIILDNTSCQTLSIIV
jgi:hypothetical protein